MRSLLIALIVLFAAGCDPVLMARYVVQPLAPEGLPDDLPASGQDTTIGGVRDSIASQSVAIARVLAKRYELAEQWASESCSLAVFRGWDEDGRLWLTMCVTEAPDGVQFVISEGITARWGPKAHSLQRDLTDSLRIVGTAVKKVN